jgi:TonB family protein
MRLIFVYATFFMLAWMPAAGQRKADTASPAAAALIAPVLLPTDVTVSMPKHCEELDGIIQLDAVIDAAGRPHELKALRASDPRLIGFATEVIEAQRFVPGTIQGAPTAVAIELTVGLQTCAEREKHPTNNNFYQFTLRAHPMIALAVVVPQAQQETHSATSKQGATVEQVGGSISAPIPVALTDPEIPISRKLPKRGRCFVGITIDTHGVPQNIHVVRGLAPELDANVLDAAKEWRFKPALRDGKSPVAVEGTVVGTFVYVQKQPVAFANFIPTAPEKVLSAIAKDRDKHFTLPSSNLKPINGDEVIARYMPSSRVTGLCLVSIVIDTRGVPQNVHIIKGLDSGVDVDTVAMIQHLRFKPVLKDGKTPVSIGMIIPVRYRATLEKPTWRELFFDLAQIPILLLL